MVVNGGNGGQIRRICCNIDAISACQISLIWSAITGCFQQYRVPRTLFTLQMTRIQRTPPSFVVTFVKIHYLMKRILTLLLATGLVATSYAQDASQPKGSWYLGTGDATTMLHLFSTGVDIAPTIGYAVADDIVVTAKAGFGGAFDALDLSLGGQYFMGDYYVGLDLMDPINDLDLGINAGRYIDFKDVLYVAPQVNVNMLLNDPVVGLSIGFGTRF